MRTSNSLMDRKSSTHSHRQQSFKCDKKLRTYVAAACRPVQWWNCHVLYIWTTKMLRSLRRLIWEIIAVKWVSEQLLYVRSLRRKQPSKRLKPRPLQPLTHSNNNNNNNSNNNTTNNNYNIIWLNSRSLLEISPISSAMIVKNVAFWMFATSCQEPLPLAGHSESLLMRISYLFSKPLNDLWIFLSP